MIVDGWMGVCTWLCMHVSVGFNWEFVNRRCSNLFAGEREKEIEYDFVKYLVYTIIYVYSSRLKFNLLQILCM